MLLYGIGLTLGGFVLLGVILALFQPFYGPTVFLVIEVVWIVYAIYKMIVGFRGIGSEGGRVKAVGNIAFGAGAILPLLLL